MRFVAVDTETDLIVPGVLAPFLVCVSVAERVDGQIRMGLYDHVQGVAVFEALLRDDDVTLVFHNGPYDLAVFAREAPWLLPLIYRALSRGRIADTQTREQLIMIRRGDMTFQTVKVDAEDVDGSEDADAPDDEDDGESAAWKRTKKNYTLAGLVAHYLRRKLDKGEGEEDGGPRLTFGPLRGTPIEQWSERHRHYAMDDAGTTLEVFECQAPHDETVVPPTPLCEKYVSPDERLQVAAGFALHLCAVRGVRVDAELLDVLETKLEEMQKRLGVMLLRSQLVRPKKTKGVIKLSRNMTLIKALVAQSFNERSLPTPMTNPSKKFPHGQVSTSKDTVEAAAAFDYPKGVKSDDRSRWLAGLPVVVDKVEIPGITADDYDAATQKKPAAALSPLVAFAQTQKILGTYVAPMKMGVVIPMNSRPNTLVETGRTSWGAMTLKINDKKVRIGGNLQNLPRMAGVRDCFVPREGYWYSATDYDSLELRTLAQAMIRLTGRSILASRYQADPDFDPHTAFAGRLMGLNYAQAMEKKKSGDKEIKRLRQMGKVANFGLPGGLGVAKLIDYARKGYDVIITLSEAEQLRDTWFAENPEMREYFAHVSAVVEAGGSKGGTYTQIGSGRVRGGCGYCDMANGFFQGLAADGAKSALFAVSAECHADPTSPLFGSHPVIFIHDEIIAEVPIEVAHEASMRVVEIMVREMQRFTPDVPIRATPTLMDHWYKAAEPVYDAAGRLVLWTPR